MTTIRQMCDTYNVTPRTLRYYEQRGLLSPIRHGNRREFTEACKKRVELILRLKGFGFSLDDVEAVLRANDDGLIGKDAVIDGFICDIVNRSLTNMLAEQKRLYHALADLREAIDPAQGMKDFELEGV